MYPGGLKRLFDVALAAAALLVLSPVLVLIALAIRISDPGPIIFRQQRVGAHGRSFKFYKFRSMPVDTRDVPSDQIGDLRLSWIGRVIRRTNLDELPQLWNVLKGDMSIVGPRPPLAAQTELVARRLENGALACRPGLTGLAQVKSFDGMSVAEKAAFDGDYAARVSFIRDAGIIVRTFGYLLKPPPKY